MRRFTFLIIQQNIINVIQSRIVRWMENVARIVRHPRCAKNMINAVNGRVRAQLSVVEKTLLGRRHILASMLGHHQVSKKYLMKYLMK
jgi:hypothetical protein